MGIEIERKFLVKDASWKAMAGEGLVCRQGYLCSSGGRTVRIRVLGDQAFLTIKGPSTGISRDEFEYEIPMDDAEAMLKLCDGLVEKTRYLLIHAALQWELDVFAGANTGLIMAEIELNSEAQPIDLPSWAGLEVTGDKRYYNAYLAQHPFSQWG